MLSRRVLRIKAYQALYAHQAEGHDDTKSGVSFIKRSLQHIEKSYYTILNLPLELKHYIITEGNPSEFKYLPTKADIESGNTFIYNKVIALLEADTVFKKRREKNSFSWLSHKDFLRKVFYEFKSGEIFKQFIAIKEKNFEVERKLIYDFYKEFLYNMADFDQLMEEDNMNWHDDKHLVMGFIYKTIENIKDDGEENYLMDFEESRSEDEAFSCNIYERTLSESQLFKTMISEKTEKWDTERIAQTDLILMEMALCEMMRFPEIPLKVTLNEYLDIAKMYSTPKSHVFINGILDKLMNELRQKGLIQKQGRGLVEN